MVYFAAVRRLEQLLETGFERWARLVVRFPKTVMALSVVVCLVLSVGWVRINFESDGAKLYAPDDSRAWTSRRALDNSFGQALRMEMFVVAPPGESILTTARLTQLREIYESFSNWPTYQASCDRYRPDLPCNVISIVQFFGGPTLTAFDAMLAQSETSRLATLVAAETSAGGPPALGGLVGGVTRDPTTKALTQVRALSITFSVNVQIGNDAVDTLTRDFVERGLPVGLSFVVNRFTTKSIGQEVEESVGGDVFLVAIGMVLTIGYTLFTLGKRHRIYSRGLVGMLAVANVTLSIVGGWGFVMLCGLEFASLVTFGAFVSLGVGVDDAFILMGSLEEIRHEDAESGASTSPEDRVVRAFRRSALTITTTSLTDILAFALGSISPVPAITIFCAYAAAALTVDYFMQISFFVGGMVLDERRIDAHRWDWIPCVTAGAKVVHESDDSIPLESLDASGPSFSASGSGSNVGAIEAAEQQEEEAQQATDNHNPLDSSSLGAPAAKDGADDSSSYTMMTAVSSSGSGASSSRGKSQGEADLGEPKRGFVTQFIMDIYAPGIAKPAVAGLVLVLVVGWWAFSLYATTELGQGIDLRILAPKDSYVVDALDTREYLFPETYRRTFFTTRPEAWHDPAVWVRLREMHADLVGSFWILSDYGAWFLRFEAWVATHPVYGTMLDATARIPVPEAAFYAAVAEFTADPPGSSYSQAALASSVEMSADNSSIVAFQFQLAARQTFAMQDEQNSLNDVRDRVDAANLGIETFMVRDLFTEQYAVLIPSVMQTLILALVSVAVVTLVMVKHPWTAFLIVLMIVGVDVSIFAVMFLADYKVNSVTLINLVIAVGGAVDACVHIAHAYMVPGGSMSRTERTVFSLEHIGPSVVFGLASSLIAVFPVAFSKSNIFLRFGALYATVLIAAGVHGLIALPALMSFVGPRGAFCCSPPDPWSDDDDDDPESGSGSSSESSSSASSSSSSS